MQARIAFTRAVAAVALLKIGIGLLAVAVALVTNGANLDSRDALFVALVTVYAAASLLLLKGGRRDERAMLLGVTFLLVATTFADRLFGVWRGSQNLALAVARGIFALHVDAFMPYYLWSFARDFPRVQDDARTRRRLALIVRATAVLGVVLVTVNIASWFAAPSAARGDQSPFFLFSRYNTAGAYWIAQFVCFLGALTLLQVRATRAPRDEARRVALLVTALVAGTGPSVIWLLASVSSGVVAQILPLRRAGWIIYPTLLATPFASAYAVLVRRALDVGVVVRAAVQYAVTRYAVQLGLAIPVVMLGASLYAGRDRSVTQLAASPRVLLLAAFTAVGIVVARGRHGVLDHIDRHFFREQYDARHVLGELVDRCRRATTRLGLERVLRAEIECALHPDAVDVLLMGEDGGAYVSVEGHLRPLPRDSALSELLSTSSTPLDVDIADQRTRIARLPEADRHWLVDGNVHLLVPLRDASEQLIGFVALGEKRSELPYTRDDRELLMGVVAEAEMTIAYRQLEPAPPARDVAALDAEPNALECLACNAVAGDATERCPRCGGPLTGAAVPLVVGGKFRVEERLGAGGMGVVYRAVDLHLGRVVAIKTLPFVSPTEALVLRREARAMALVSHANLAQIFGLETLQGRPMLIVEYLGGGTLAARLKKAPLATEVVLDLGIGLASGLAAVHDAGILHRDVKPGNIAFSANGVPKLLDFGLARLMSAARREDVSRRDRPPDGGASEVGSLSSRAGSTLEQGVLIGTPEYMSPEAIRGEPPDMGLDLWSLCIVLYESISGRNPLAGSKLCYTGDVVRRAPVPDLRELVPGAPELLAAFFKRVLAEDARERPQTASALIRALSELQAKLATDSGFRGPPPSLVGLRRRSRRQTA